MNINRINSAPNFGSIYLSDIGREKDIQIYKNRLKNFEYMEPAKTHKNLSAERIVNKAPLINSLRKFMNSYKFIHFSDDNNDIFIGKDKTMESLMHRQIKVIDPYAVLVEDTPEEETRMLNFIFNFDPIIADKHTGAIVLPKNTGLNTLNNQLKDDGYKLSLYKYNNILDARKNMSDYEAAVIKQNNMQMVVGKNQEQDKYILESIQKISDDAIYVDKNSDTQTKLSFN